MESYQLKHVTFMYPNQAKPALSDICLTIRKGDFVTMCGKSGCGKTTLLRQLKSVLAPHGTLIGEILFEGTPLSAVDHAQQSSKIGFVMQSPDNQIVTDKVWHELAFGLESMGMKTPEIRARVAEMASFFGIQTWFHKSVAELSGGQKQLLNLASIMVMQPSVLILDEPTSQLDPIAAADFLDTIYKINQELGTTVILTEHRLEEVFPMSDRIVVMAEGSIIADGTPQAVGEQLKQAHHEMAAALPTPMRVYAAVENALPCPVTVREGREWLETMAEQHVPDAAVIPADTVCKIGESCIELRDVWFRYEKDAPDVIKGLSASIYEGELFAIVGGNGTGKTTALSLISGMLRPYRGAVWIDGRQLRDIPESERYNGLLGVLPQNPQALFVKKTVALDLQELLKDRGMSSEEQHARVAQAASLCELGPLLEMHPYDLSGGEQQRAALAKVLLLEPRILLLDEPTKGLDAHFKEKLAGILQRLQAGGVTIVMVSHDIEFCAKHADRCAMFFDGAITSCDTPRAFFSGKNFYTTAANRMARTILPQAVLAEDLIRALGGQVQPSSPVLPSDAVYTVRQQVPSEPTADSRKLSAARLLAGGGFLILFVLTAVLLLQRFTGWQSYVVQFLLVLELGAAFVAFFPGKELVPAHQAVQPPKEKRRLSKRTVAALVMIVLAIPLTIFVGLYYLGDRKYYFISLLILLEAMLPFALVFESKKPQARELVIIGVLCAIAVASRAAFFMLPQFKPVLALVIIAGVCFGGETGFLVGAMTGFVSNFFFGQGPWSPWQMFAFGVIGFLAGILFRKGLLRKTRGALCLYGGFAAVVIYGGIMNPAAVLIWQAHPTWAMVLTAYLAGLPFDMVHAAATVFFLWFIAGPMIEKLERIKVKYGLLER